MGVAPIDNPRCMDVAAATRGRGLVADVSLDCLMIPLAMGGTMLMDVDCDTEAEADAEADVDVDADDALDDALADDDAAAEAAAKTVGGGIADGAALLPLCMFELASVLSVMGVGL